MSRNPRIVLVVAVAENGVIGRNGDLPWRLPGDLKHFKAVTIGKPILMGRRTFLSIGRPLPGRTNIVLTRDPAFRADGVLVAPSIEAGLELARTEAERLGADEIAIIGGGELYADTLTQVSRIYLTEVHAAPRGTAYFPKLDLDEWREVAREGPLQGAGDAHSYSFVVLDRR
ncbi:MAG: dihydrofolate reductase [Bradyrhizobiaceae bacterium]|nr:dihydrofolate reductase [Bradyrhizobiaceae bacterium]